MNFYGHLVIGTQRSADPAFLLGTMLPDFAGMAGLRRLSAPTHHEMHDGIQLHHATDAAFHAAPTFAQAVAQGVEALSGRGLERGPARAVAHVGVELLLDGLLVDDDSGPGPAPYHEALATALDPAVAVQLETVGGQDTAPLLRLIGRLQAAPIPEGYREPAFVAGRLELMLARRPRLALQDGQVEVVATWLAEIQSPLRARVPSLLNETQSGLARMHNTPRGPSRIGAT